MESAFVDNLNKRIATRLSRPPMSSSSYMVSSMGPSMYSPMALARRPNYTGLYVALGVGTVAVVIMLLVLLRNR